MALMIPALPHPDCASDGERSLFRRLADAPGTSAWIVLHSLALASHPSPAGGEADFVVIVPELGVVVLEVKACRSFRYEEGAWFYGADAVPDRRGPFRQAQEAMWSLRAWVNERRRDLASVLFTSAVVFPFCRCPLASPEWHPWQLIDAERYQRQSIDESIGHVLTQASLLWRVPREGGRPAPTGEWARELAALLRPRFEAFETPVARAARLDAEVRRFTEDQFRYLDLLEANARVLVDGHAGTGKTLLAMEAARRGVRMSRAEGGRPRRVLVVCFNRPLGAWLREQLWSLRDSVHVTTFHRFLLDVSGIVGPPADADRRFWYDELPARAAEALRRAPEGERYAELVLDEAQDLARDSWLDVLDLALYGGLAGGRWRAFSDLAHQSIYGSADSARAVCQARLAKHAVLATLRDNCRNRPRIVEVVHLLARLDTPYRATLRPDDGRDYDLRFHADDDEQRRHLVEVITTLRGEGFIDDDIVILHPRSQCAATDMETLAQGAIRFRPLVDARPGAIRHGTIHAFKGLEARAIILADIGDIEGLRAQALFYVGVTRAQERLAILADTRVKAQLVGFLLGSGAAAEEKEQEHAR